MSRLGFKCVGEPACVTFQPLLRSTHGTQAFAAMLLGFADIVMRRQEALAVLATISWHSHSQPDGFLAVTASGGLIRFSVPTAAGGILAFIQF